MSGGGSNDTACPPGGNASQNKTKTEIIIY